MPGTICLLPEQRAVQSEVDAVRQVCQAHRICVAASLGLPARAGAGSRRYPGGRSSTEAGRHPEEGSPVAGEGNLLAVAGRHIPGREVVHPKHA